MLKKIEEALQDNEVDERNLKQLEVSLTDQKAELKSLDHEMLERMYDAEVSDKVCDNKAKGASNIMERVVYNVICLEDTLKTYGYQSDAESCSLHRSVSQESM